MTSRRTRTYLTNCQECTGELNNEWSFIVADTEQRANGHELLMWSKCVDCGFTRSYLIDAKLGLHPVEDAGLL